MKTLQIITTGGTIDKVYFDDKSDYEIGPPEIGRILEDTGIGFEVHINALMRKDSLHFNAEDRALIRNVIAHSSSKYFLITHGTDTMVDTAMELLDIEDKVIVLTGSLKPARFRDSDAVFNIGCAVGAVQCLSTGVYISMNGKVWDPRKVKKNHSAHRFEASE